MSTMSITDEVAMTLTSLPDDPTPTSSSILGTVITIEEIQEKIKLLSTLETGEVLKDAMGELKLALRQNPEAANLLLPTEIGELVKHLRKITATEVTQADGKDKERAVKKAMKSVDLNDPEFLNQALKDF